MSSLITTNTFKYKIFVPSFQRVAILRKADIIMEMEGEKLPLYVFVNEEDYSDYKFLFRNVIVTPSEIEGKLARKRNWILDNFWKDEDFILFMDDDVRSISLNYTSAPLSALTFLNHIIVDIVASWPLGEIGAIGFYDGNRNVPKARFLVKIFRYNVLINSGCVVLLDKNLRYDENLWIREDVDLTMQMLHKYGITVRDERLGLDYVSIHSRGAGGDRMQTRAKKLLADREYLIRKWAGDIGMLMRIMSDNMYAKRF